MPKHELILLKNMMQPGYTGSLADYEKAGGYQALRKVVGKVQPRGCDRHGHEVRAYGDAAAQDSRPESNGDSCPKTTRARVISAATPTRASPARSRTAS